MWGPRFVHSFWWIALLLRSPARRRAVPRQPQFAHLSRSRPGSLRFRRALCSALRPARATLRLPGPGFSWLLCFLAPPAPSPALPRPGQPQHLLHLREDSRFLFGTHCLCCQLLCVGLAVLHATSLCMEPFASSILAFVAPHRTAPHCCDHGGH